LLTIIYLYYDDNYVNYEIIMKIIILNIYL